MFNIILCYICDNVMIVCDRYGGEYVGKILLYLNGNSGKLWQQLNY